MPNNTISYTAQTSTQLITPILGTLPCVECKNIYFHGGCVGNHQADQSQRIMKIYVHTNGGVQSRECGSGGSNYQAAYLALIRAAKIASSEGITDALFLGHNAIMINQVNGAIKTKEQSLKLLRERFHEVSAGFNRYYVRQIPKSDNLALSLITLH